MDNYPAILFILHLKKTGLHLRDRLINGTDSGHLISDTAPKAVSVQKLMAVPAFLACGQFIRNGINLPDKKSDNIRNVFEIKNRDFHIVRHSVTAVCLKVRINSNSSETRGTAADQFVITQSASGDIGFQPFFFLFSPDAIRRMVTIHKRHNPDFVHVP